MDWLSHNERVWVPEDMFLIVAFFALSVVEERDGAGFNSRQVGVGFISRAVAGWTNVRSK